MLNIGVLAGVDSVDYYLGQVASGVEDYYAGRGEAPGRWMGAAATDLGLAGRVDAETLRAVLAGADPRSGQLLGRRSTRKVPGFDLTFRPPKSVSVLWALADDDISTQVRDAHDAAVAAALGYLESAAARSRRGSGGHEDVVGRGFVAAAFRHRASRAGDPLLHTHVLVANVVQAVDDEQWRTLNSRALFRHAKTAGYLYQVQLRHELTRRVGVAWQPVTNGYADIDGVPATVLRAFSQRRVEIERRMSERGDTSAAAAQVATLDTRRPKPDVDAATLTDRWHQRAADLGYHRDDLAAAVGRRGCESIPQPVLDHETAAVAAPTGVTRHRSTFTRRETIQHLSGRLDAAADTAQVLACADTALRGPDVVVLPSGRRVEQHYTTTELLAVEQHLVTVAGTRRNGGVAVASQRAVDVAIAQRPTLHPEQTGMIRQLCGDGDGVAVVVGKAGTGKTFAVAGASQAWEQSGHQVIGCTLAGNAANQLADATGIPSYTIASLLRWLDHHPERDHLRADTVVIVDEAGMVGTRTLARLVDHTTAAGAKLVLIGDHHQLPEIDAGGAFAGLVARTDPITLTVNRRQRQQWERDTLDRLRDGTATADVVDAYRKHGRLTIADTADRLRERLVTDWWDAWQTDGAATGVMIALRVADIDDLNRRARTRLQTAGLVNGPAVTTGDGVEFQRGDRIVTRLGHTFPAADGGRVASPTANAAPSPPSIPTGAPSPSPSTVPPMYG